MVLVVGCVGITYTGAIINSIRDKVKSKKQATKEAEEVKELIEK